MKSIKSLTLTLGLAAASTLFLAGCSDSQQASHDHDGHDHGAGAHAAVENVADAAGAAAKLAVIEKPTAEQLAAAKPYPLDTCIVSEEKLGGMGEPIVLVVGDQQIKLCCESCLDDVKKDPPSLIAKLSK